MHIFFNLEGSDSCFGVVPGWGVEGVNAPMVWNLIFHVQMRIFLLGGREGSSKLLQGWFGTPLHAGRQCWGKTILPGAGYGLGTYRTVDIFNFSLILLAILEKRRFLCFYIIKSIARKIPLSSD